MAQKIFLWGKSSDIERANKTVRRYAVSKNCLENSARNSIRLDYGEIAREAARRLGKLKMSAQAVGQAVGQNPISIIIPCHRVIGANGNLTGYNGGIDVKIKLLEIEGIDTSRMSYPAKNGRRK